MSTLTRRSNISNSTNTKMPVDYKDYVNFVSSYKKTDGTSATSYSNFLEKTKNQKYATVKPPILKNDNSKDVVDSNTQNQKKIVKTEIFLQINNEDVKKNTIDIESKKKNFENIKNNSDKNERNMPQTNKTEIIKVPSVVNSTASTIFTPPPPPPMPKENAEKVQKKFTKPAIHQKSVPVNGIRNENDIKLDENLVKKLAYNAMLDMYRASHDKAKSYVATLPKSQVKKENGLQKIIDNIAAQGGLDKLTGRSNPKAEIETW